MNAVSLATKGMICPVSQVNTSGGTGGVIHMYRDRINPKITIDDFKIKNKTPFHDDDFKVIDFKVLSDEEDE